MIQSNLTSKGTNARVTSTGDGLVANTSNVPQHVDSRTDVKAQGTLFGSNRGQSPTKKSGRGNQTLVVKQQAYPIHNDVSQQHRWDSPTRRD